MSYAPPPVAPAPTPAPPVPSGSNGSVLMLMGVLLTIAGLVVLVLSVAGDDTSVATTSTTTKVSPTTTRTAVVPGADVKIIGGDGSTVNDVAANAIADIEGYWKRTMPDVYGVEYQPVTGGFYSASPDEPLPPCAESADDIAGNAFYCSTDDVVAWDGTDLVPRLRKDYGDLAVAVVFAHEWGHAVQARSAMEGATVTLEHQADCFAGAWVGDVSNRDVSAFSVTPNSIDNALAGFLELADTPGTSALDPSAHGSAFDRVNAFTDGIEGGAGVCAKYRDDNITLVELPFTEQTDLDNGGNLPYDGFVDLAVSDLEDYWSKAFDQGGEVWTPLQPARAFRGAGGTAPSCGSDDTAGYLLFYCVPDRYIGYSDDAMSAIHEQLGDFATATLIATQYGLAAEIQLQSAPSDPKAQNLLADCLAGSWGASVFLQDRPDSGTLSLSPGDLDEAVGALLSFSSTQSEDNGTQGAGFERVDAFRKGVLGGIPACVPA